MRSSNMALDIAIGIAAGMAATRVTDRAQRALYDWTPSSVKAREPHCDAPASMVAARKAAATVGVPQNARNLARLKQVIHYGLGAGWGAVYALLRRYSQMTPLGAGTVTGATLSLVVDEAVCPALGITAPSRSYPAVSHLRGFATHLVYGLALAASAEAIYRLAATRR